MRITKEIIEAHSGCLEGIAWFVEAFPNGGEYGEVLTAAKVQDDKNGHDSYAAFARMLHASATAWLMQGAAVMNEKYHVFSPLTGTHSEHITLDDALAARTEVIRQYVLAHAEMFAIAQEVTTSEGNTLWNPVPIPNP